MTQEKKCTKCHESKPATPKYFGRNKKAKDKLKHWCIKCSRDYARWYNSTKGGDINLADKTKPYIELAKHNRIVIQMNDSSEEKIQELKETIKQFESVVGIDIVQKLRTLAKNFKIKISLEVD